jgi:branched-chain amino acid transport system substrate-binding protein
MRLLKIIFSFCLTLSIQGFIQNYLLAGPPYEGIEKTVKIGLLIADNSSIEACYAAEMAISEANDKGGFNNLPFELIVRSMEGPWGTGSKQAVNMIFDEEVVAIVGSNDGRNAHLVEQVAAKARIVFISAWTGDPTLSQAFVPWFFNCAPNYLQQAHFLIKTIFDKNKHSKIALIGDGTYDSESAVSNYLKVSKLESKENPLIIRTHENKKEMDSLFLQLSKTDVNTFVLSCGPATADLFFKELMERKMSQSVYCYLSALGEAPAENKTSDVSSSGALVLTSGTWYKPEESRFNHDYRLRFHMPPGAVAAYAYDATKLIIEAIKASGKEREDIQKWLLKNQYEGVTGTIQFDEKGIRKGKFHLMIIKNGVTEALKND